MSAIDDHCHEDMPDEEYGHQPCGKAPVGYRRDMTDDGNPYPVCRQHFRWPRMTTFERIAELEAQLAAARAALAACREVAGKRAGR